MKQLDLIDLVDKALARRSDPLTSHMAANSMNNGLPRLELAVFELIKSSGSYGCTLDDAVRDLSMDKVTVSPRFKPLFDRGLIKQSGTRIGNSGRQQSVWVIV